MSEQMNKTCLTNAYRSIHAKGMCLSRDISRGMARGLVRRYRVPEFRWKNLHPGSELVPDRAQIGSSRILMLYDACLLAEVRRCRMRSCRWSRGCQGGRTCQTWAELSPLAIGHVPEWIVTHMYLQPCRSQSIICIKRNVFLNPSWEIRLHYGRVLS